MSRLPLLMVLVGIMLSLFGYRLGLHIWAFAPLTVYILVVFTLRGKLGFWVIFALIIFFTTVLSLILR
ncbi:MAG: hypothetical protein ABIL16_02515 [candidate division WOR-3 bacterium]